MKSGRVFLAVLGLALAPACAHAAAHVSLGGNLSFVQLSQGSENSTTLQVPNDVLFGVQPGIRLGFPGNRGMDDVYFDLGFVSIEHENFGAFTLNYQRNLVHAVTVPYLTVGAGIFQRDFGGNGEAHAMVGGGLGIVHRLSQRQGALRAEFHVDAVDRSPETDPLVSLGLKAGFDLYLP